ncbi:MAG TPA: serine hydrolase domain-containing protein [Vicinamibacterales bacterium]|nr:serine hydrolase domain-containing protein [Vicinamibacterales bacterium]
MSLPRLRTRVLLPGFVCAFLIVGSSPWMVAQSQRIASDSDVQGAERLFSAWIEGQLLERGLPGMAVGVVADQDLVWATGFGFADIAGKIPMTPQTRFRMASHSKLFTATAVMQLREQGKLRLDDPVSKYLPWFTVKPAEADDPPITIEELLTHSSGLPREAGAHWTTFQFPTSDELRALIPARQAAFSPEMRWKYSNLGFSVAGMVVEAVSGQKWADYVQREIFQPLGMNSSSVDKNVSGMAVGYGRRTPDGKREINPFIDARGMGAATGITSTVEDMAKFASAQFRKGPRGGSQILSTGSLREMHRVRVLENNWTQGNAIGFAVRKAGDKVYVSHGGSYPGYQTNTMLWLDGKVAVIVLTNEDDGNPAAVATELMNTVGQAVAKASTKPAIMTMWDPAWSRYAGLYRGRGGDSRVVELNKRLVIVSATAQNLDNPVQLEPAGNGQFRYVANAGGGPVGEIVRFVEENGRVTRMITGDSYVERVY